jgi:hypothetical protein
MPGRPADALGEAMTGALLVTNLMAMLREKGILSRDEIEMMLDHLLLVLERNRELAPGCTAATDHARLRLEDIRLFYATQSE